MKIEECTSVQNWFNHEKKPYAKQTKEVYIKYMGLFCKILNKTPNEIVATVKGSRRPIDAMENIEKTLASAMENMEMKARSIHQRLNALHNFWRANGIRLTPEIMEQIQSKISKHIRRLAARIPKRYELPYV